MLSENAACTHNATGVYVIQRARAQKHKILLVNIAASQVAHLKRKRAPCGDQRL
jgi:hypothetical protein